MPTEKLDRSQSHQINAHQGDEFHLWESPIDSERQNLTLRSKNGDDVLKVFAHTHDQLANLYDEIGLTLGKSPSVTLHHLKRMRDTLDRLIAHDKASGTRSEFDSFEG